MARLFDDASSQYLEVTSALVSAEPVSFSCLFRSNNADNTGTLVSLGNSTTNSRINMQAAGATAGDPILIISGPASGASASASTSTGFSANTWHQAGGVSSASNSRAAYIDGGSKGTNTSSITVGSLNRTNIGCRWSSGARSTFMSGDIAEAGIWNVALTDAEMAILGKFVSPRFVRPESLVAYWPVLGRTSPEINLFSTSTMTVSGATQSAHPRVYWPSKKRIFLPTPVAAEVVQPWIESPSPVQQHRQYVSYGGL